MLAWIALLAGYGWCAGTGICDARIAAGVSNLRRFHHNNIEDF